MTIENRLPEVSLNTDQLASEYELGIWQTLVLGGKAYLNFLSRHRRDLIGMAEGFARAVSEGSFWPELVEFPLEGLSFAEALKRSDRAVNNYVWELYNFGESGQVAREAMENENRPDHSFRHLRCNEEWIEAMLLRDTAVRHETKMHYRLFLPAIYLANRNHDLFEQINSRKDSHAELGAIFTLASYKLIAKTFGVSQEEAWLYCRAAALMILPHSNPELLTDPQAVT